MMPAPSIFCNKCETFMLDAMTCPNCGWESRQEPNGNDRLFWSQSLQTILGEPHTKFAKAANSIIVSTEKKNSDHTRTGTIVALNINDGNIRWQFSLDKGRISRIISKAGNLLLVGSQDMRTLPVDNNNLIALDAQTGKVAWTLDIEAHSLSPAAVLNDTVFVTTNNYKGIAVDKKSGTKLWEINELPAWSSELPTVGDSQFIFGSRDPVLTLVDAKTGEKGVLFTGKEPFLSEFAYKNNILFSPCMDKHLYAFDVATLKMKWKAQLARGASSPPVIGKHLYIGVKETVEGRPAYSLWAVDTQSGERVWRFETTKHILAPPVVLENTLIVTSRDGHLYEISSETGEEQWSYKVEGRIVTQPTCINNLICFGTKEGQIYTVYRDHNHQVELESADLYRASEQWDLAGVADVLNGNYYAAAQDFEKLGETNKSAQLYEHVQDWEKAATLYLSGEKVERAIYCYQKAGDRAGEAKALISVKRFEEAGDIFKSIKQMTEAAAAYEKAGRMNQAAACYEAAGKQQNAVRIYLALQKPEEAARIYIENKDIDKAVKVYKETGLPRKAVELLRKQGRLTEAVEVLTELEEWEEAANICLEDKDTSSAAKLFERAKRWVQAAELWLESKEFNRAAELYRQIGDLKKAANLYEELKDLDTAKKLYKQLQDANSLKRLSYWEEAADVYLQMEPPLALEAAKCYEEAGNWSKAAELFAQNSRYEKSARSWLKIGESEKALEVIQRAEPGQSKAKFLEELKAPDEAALVWIGISKPNEAVRLYLQMGRTQDAFDLLRANRAWQSLKDLANELNEHEQEARACIELVRDKSWDQQVDLYYSAAQALVRAAKKYEQEQSREISDIANLWEEAADCFEQAFERDSVAECRNEVRRLRKEPFVEVSIMTEGALIAEEWGYLHIGVNNVGYGPAFLISFHILSDLFEGEDFFRSQKIRGLRQGQHDILKLRIRPKLDAIGEAAPLDVELSYSLPNREEFKRIIRCVLLVKRSPSQQITPLELTPNSITTSGNTIIQIYSDDNRIRARSSTILQGIPDGLNEEDMAILRYYRHFLVEYFSYEELQSLCFDLGILHDHLEGKTVPTKADALIIYCYQRSLVDKLHDRLFELRPHLKLPGGSS